ncbi:site-2 protease family protein [Filibacter tadaridae]|uniref:Stage IV sporulation protein FB n=1 Tax=Filibacter tadaridae TaxID=2483811 RepID=A0A3P5XU86_9BACL|nr:site-2 protease family protein [Filibacter tadaridae]VDC32607.1 Stage IV sporulation protein FB [Filibacter tadaridae]
MKFRLHPVLLPIFFILIVTGGLSLYALLFISLLIHEAGHLLLARLTGMRVRSCTIMPYGGEIIFADRLTAPKKDRILVALGGPVATLLLLIAAMVFPFPGDDQVIRIQLALLFLNLLPILPLDGGQALSALLETDGNAHETRAHYLLSSIFLLGFSIILLLTGLPETLPYVLLALFLFLQNISVFRFRKYEKAFHDLKIKQLT